MPSGRTHDSITLWSLPILAGITFERTQSSSLTLLVSGSFLFSGLMFGPDLDIRSQQYRRWGFLRWIWLPYRKAMRHRSVWSHGPIVGTVLRIGYLLVWSGLLAVMGMGFGAMAVQLLGWTTDGRVLAQQWAEALTSGIGRSLQQSPLEWFCVAVGLELGALSHVLSDWAGSAYKRLRQAQTRDRSRRNQPEPARAAATEAAQIVAAELPPPSLPAPLNPPNHPLLPTPSLTTLKPRYPLPPPAPWEPKLPEFGRPRKD